MSRDYFVFHAGRSVVPGGMYDQHEAEKVAINAAKRHPGRTYTVLMQVVAYKFPKPAKP